MKLSILYEDDSLLVADKQAGITVNRSDTTQQEETLQDLVDTYLGNKPVIQQKKEQESSDTDDSSEYPDEFEERSGIVHRLDKETSGVIVIAKTKEAFKELQKQFKERSTEKEYIALVHGKVLPPEGEINIPVGRLPWNRRQFGIVAGGRESVTLYTVKAYLKIPGKKSEVLTLLRLFPKTGRTHQIRVHLQYLKHPIFADFLYAGRKTAREDRRIVPRVFLHAAQLCFTHPQTGERLCIESPLPQELRHVLNLCTPVPEPS